MVSITLVKMGEQDFTPRNYQVELMKIALEQNTIIFLPTGSGKTFIGLLVLKRLGESLLKSYGQGGKISVILVNKVALVDQYASYINAHTDFDVGRYTGEMNLDFWPRYKWYAEYEKYQVFIMTSQILVNLVNNSYIDLNKVNLIIFDECHRGVNDHSMRQLMKSFQTLREPPRVLGLTATLLNGNCKPGRVICEVKSLETTYQSKVATVEELKDVVGYSTNPKENVMSFRNYVLVRNDALSVQMLAKILKVVKAVRFDEPIPVPLVLNGLKPLGGEELQKKLVNLIIDLQYHIETMGTYGGYKACRSHIIQIERLKKHCDDLTILDAVQTMFTFVNEQLKKSMDGYEEKDKIFLFSSDKIIALIKIFKEFKQKSKEELCCIVFTKRRFTAVIYHILSALSGCDPEFSHIKANFMVAYNSNPYNATRETMYTHKQNRQVLDSFVNKEINVLVSSNVLEEGVDIPKCTLVIKYDYPEDYRSYIQSKGRARHKESLYYMIVSYDDTDKFTSRYHEHKMVEDILNNYLVGMNEEREEPSQENIDPMYNEDKIPPYYVDGNTSSAQVNMVSAIPLLCQYCASLPSDVYTVHAPDWYVMKDNGAFRVVILLPVVSKILDTIEGPWMSNTRLAKRAAALKACIQLHQAGELDDHLLPIKNVVKDEDVSYLFSHYPDEKDPFSENLKTRRLHKKLIPRVLQKQIIPYSTVYVHFIQLDPLFKKSEDIHISTLYDMYTSSQCYGIVTHSPLPTICDFPIYVTLGTINVSLRVNRIRGIVTEMDLEYIKKFHVQVFDGVLNILHRFLVFDTGNNPEMMLLVPVNKQYDNIDWNVLRADIPVNLIEKLNNDEKLNLEVTQESYLKKIVSPWYRKDPATYVVTEQKFNYAQFGTYLSDGGVRHSIVPLLPKLDFDTSLLYAVVRLKQFSEYTSTSVCLNMTANSPFPNDEFRSFTDYFKKRHSLELRNPNLPLLLVKGLTNSLNFIKPKGMAASKRKPDKIHVELEEYLPAELVVKQEFPASLWIQANFMPTVLSRISFMLQLEELRCKIVREKGLGLEIVNIKMPLQLDEYLLNYQPYIEEDSVELVAVNVNSIPALPPPITLRVNKDFSNKILESQYPWKDIDEPKDIERNLDVSIVDIEHYETFIGHKVNSRELRNVNSSLKQKQLALTYHKDFVPVEIKLLDTPPVSTGPELCELYRALTSAKANEIVNLERLETLGDSFLKLISSVYIYIRFPQYDEVRAATLKGRLISNRNLYYLALKKNLNGVIKYNELSPQNEWLPQAFTIPKQMLDRIDNKELSLSAVFGLSIPLEEQISGHLSNESIEDILNDECPQTDSEECNYPTVAHFLKCQYIGDKHIADVVESLIGTYFKTCGFAGGIKLIEWIGLIPESENLADLLKRPLPDPVLVRDDLQNMIRVHLPFRDKIEEIIGYKFNNRGYLLQALTHSSYSSNRTTLSYEKLEFLGDAVLDFLITCHIFESCENLDPGKLTDLRSALVNNNTFACLVVRLGLHKYILMINSKLQGMVDKFVKFMEQKNYIIDDEVMILLQEDEYQMAESVDVPKILGDVFEAIAGAIYLDSNRDLKTVWRVFYKIMWKEIDLFSRNVPVNIVRKLFEWNGAHPKFGKPGLTDNNKSMVSLQFLLDDIPTVVHGFGTNRVMAKKAAAKLALRLLLENKDK